MKDPSSTHPELIEEISLLKQRIKELEQSESDLKINEQRFRSLSEASLEAIVFIENGIIVDANKALNRLFGYEGEELRGKSAADFIAPEKRPFTIEKMFTRAEGAYETLGLRKDGSTFPIEVNPHEFEHEGKKLRISAVRDITERKRAVEALAESERLYRTLFETANDAIFLHKGYRIFDCNQKACDLYGVTRDQIIGKEPHEVSPILQPGGEESTKKARQKIDKAFQGKSQHFEWSHCIGGKRHDVEITLKAVEMGGERYVMAVSRDITERKKSEEALRESEELFRNVFDNHAAIKLLIDPGTGNIIGANKAAAEYYGWSKEELCRMNIMDINTFSQDAVKQEMEKARTLQRTYFEFRHRRADGTVRDVAVFSSNITTKDKAVLHSIIHDITSRKLAEQEKRILEDRLQQADKMKSIGTLAGGIAHDFNNLLMGIEGYASLMLLDLDPSHPFYEKLKRIEGQVQRGADLAGQLLSFARGGRYEVKTADMNDVIKRTSSLFARTRKEIAVRRKHAKDLWNADVDLGQMERVLMNLYINAWQAMSGGGELYLETGNVHLDNEQAFPHAVKPGNYVRISVTDNGTGMDEETRKRIFDPFFTTKEMGRGTGLGLATVYGIIEGHKGFINVYSEPGRGTTFNIYLPASEKEAVKERAPAGAIVKGTETILLVDDEQTVLDVCREMLMSLGYRVYPAGSGREAIDVYTEKGSEIGLVILDMIMPGLSGGGTFDRLRELNPLAKIVLSSGYSINGQAQEIMDKGCNGFIQKPFQLQELSGKIREMLDSE